MRIRNQYFTAIMILSLIITAACGPAGQDKNGEENTDEAAKTEEETKVYTAMLSSLNQNITDQPVSGTLSITVDGDEATIELNVSSIAPGMMHLAHLHGFEDGSEAFCPPVPDADDNGDEVVDLIETRNYSGITMIPFHENPVSMKIKTHSYPEADDEGNYKYTKTISVQELKSAVEEKFGITDFDFADYVIYVHGVSDQTTLPASVQSLPDVPAKVTLPVACGELH